MLQTVLLVVLVLLALYVSMGIRVNRIATARRSSYEETNSPLGQAIKDFVAVAGGTYLGLMAVAEFLKVPVPMQAEVWGTTFDPIALFAITLSIVVPVLPFGRGRY
ncbi:MAG: hypothetical protein ACOX3V_04450 [Bacillota bacterium]